MKIILKRKPKEYLKQGLSYCGGYTIKGILSAFGKDDGEVKNYTSLFGITTGHFIVKKLKTYRFNAKLESAKSFTNKNKLEMSRTIH